MAKRRITEARIRHISLCGKGANNFPAIFKDADHSVELSLLTKAGDDFAEKGELLAVVYAPEIEDLQGDVASAEVIKDAMHNFAKAGDGVDICHDNKTLSKDAVYVAESFEIQAGDPRFVGFENYDGEPVDVTGGWGIVLKIESEDLKVKYRNGDWEGVSMGGTGSVEVCKLDEDVATTILRALAENMNLNISAFGSLDMTPEQIEALLKTNNEALAKSLGETVIPQAIAKTLTEAGLIKALPPAVVPPVQTPTATPVVAATPPADGRPIFKGDATAENIAKHSIAMRRWNALQDVGDFTDVAKVNTFQEVVTQIDKDETALTAEPVKKSDEVLALEKQVTDAQEQIAKLAKGSNQPVATPLDKQETEDIRLAKYGSGLAAQLNKQRGFVTAGSAA